MDMSRFREDFHASLRDQLRAIEQTMTVFNALIDQADQRFHELQENDAELKRLILEQGEQLRAQGEQLRALQRRLEGQ
jgi:hypothetical protein